MYSSSHPKVPSSTTELSTSVGSESKKRELAISIAKVLDLNDKATKVTMKMLNELPIFGLETLCFLRILWPFQEPRDQPVLSVLYDASKDEAELLAVLRRMFYQQLNESMLTHDDFMVTWEHLQKTFHPRVSSKLREKMYELAVTLPAYDRIGRVPAIIAPSERTMVTSVPPAMHANRSRIVDSTIRKVEASIYSIDRSAWKDLPNEMLTTAIGCRALPERLRRGAF